MSGLHIFDQVRFARQATLNQCEQLTEEQADVQPEGFNNTIRWNLGHILTVQERLAIRITSIASLPETYQAWFGPGSKPSDWKEAPPSLSELKAQLQKQSDHLEHVLKERLHQPLDEPINIRELKLTTPEHLLQFSIYHEGQHCGIIKAMLKLV